MEQTLDNVVADSTTNGQINYHTLERVREYVLDSEFDYFDAAEYLDGQYGLAI